MVNIRIIAVGRKKSELENIEGEYLKRLSAFCFCSLECAESDEAALRKIKKDEALILLDEHGKEYVSKDFARWFSKYKDQGVKLVFLIGGAYGVGEEAKKRSREMISLSKMTLPHLLVRTFLLEQLYRAFTIIKGMHYHH